MITALRSMLRKMNGRHTDAVIVIDNDSVDNEDENNEIAKKRKRHLFRFMIMTRIKQTAPMMMMMMSCNN